jgi:alcohol dehydrogenase
MRALIFDGTAARLDKSYPAPKAGAGEAVIRLARGAVSALDLEISRGLLGFKGVLGHQFVGVVESVNAPAPREGGLSGKRVVGSIVTACGKCDMCQAGLSGHCRSRTVMGMMGRNGCFAERFALPAQNLVVVPDSLDNDHAVFAIELAAAMQAARQLTVVGRPYITVLGDGSLGLLTAQVMAKLNASVRVVGKHSNQLERCEKWGIKHRLIDDVGRRADQDIVVDCTGVPEGLELAMQLVRPRGKIVLKSLYAASTHSATQTSAPGSQRLPIDYTPIVTNEIEIIGSFAGPIAEGLSSLLRREFDVVSLISKRMSLDEGPAVLHAAGQPGTVKVLVDL